jgi:hypothetical protein
MSIVHSIRTTAHARLLPSADRTALDCSRLFVLLALAIAIGGEPVGATDVVERQSDQMLLKSFDERAKPFLNQYCVRCHNEKKMSSGVRIDQLDAALEDRQLKLWKAIREQIADEAMPPEDEPQPTSVEREQMVQWIEQALSVARSRPTPKNGLVRRLTVAQYRNTLRELLHLEDDLTEALPPDAVSRDGFLNNKDTLQLSPLLLEAYFQIAEEALDRCIVDVKAKPKIQNFRVDLGASINPDPCPDRLILGANSLLLENKGFTVTQLTPDKPFAFEPLRMQTKYRFIEGYEGNATVRGWREYDSIYHAVFACLRGGVGYPKGDAYRTVPQGLLLRPAIPSDDFTYGPKANFKISLRELPDDGRFRVTVTAAKYDDGLLLDPGTPPQSSDQPDAITCCDSQIQSSVIIKQPGIYQVDVFATPKQAPASDSSRQAAADKPHDVDLTLGERHFSGMLRQPAFLALRLPAGELRVTFQYAGPKPLDRIVFTLLRAEHEIARRFETFEQRSPRLGVHLGLRRDCGSTLDQVGTAQGVSSDKLSQFVFTGAIRNFPSPDVEKDNVNYLAGIREIGVRSEYTDGRDMPRLLVRSVEFEAPFYESWPPLTHRNLFVDFDRQADLPAYAREIIRQFAGRAFRRRISVAEESALVAVFEKSYGEGGGFQESIKRTLQLVLTSPQFLFLIENSRSPAPEPLDDDELASKLSYFLWNGPPDRKLLDLAASGKLRSELDNEVGRLIADPRFSRFASEFASQWLNLDKFDVLEPDREQFPRLTRDTRAQLRQEPVQFVEYLMRNNLPVRNLIESDFMVANEAVASYYDLGDKSESGFRFVPIKHGRAELGGVLTEAAIMAGLSDGRESNPVKRGAWLARRIIAEPPDDPPPNVPALENETKQLMLRQRLEKHRNQTGCAQCHSKIDPWGLPFEEFDAGGRLKLQAVDARSTLPDKTDVAGVSDLKRYLAQERIDQVAFSVLKHLATYATGRSLAYNELEFLRQHGLELKSHGYRMQDMIRFVVNSELFLDK